MTLRHRLSRLENAVGAAKGGDACPHCGWPGPVGLAGWDGFDWTVADLETLRTAYAAAEARRRASPKSTAPPRPGACPGCNDLEDLYRCFTDEELNAVGEILSRVTGGTWPTTPEESRVAMDRLRVGLAETEP